MSPSDLPRFLHVCGMHLHGAHIHTQAHTHTHKIKEINILKEEKLEVNDSNTHFHTFGLGTSLQKALGLQESLVASAENLPEPCSSSSVSSSPQPCDLGLVPLQPWQGLRCPNSSTSANQHCPPNRRYPGRGGLSSWAPLAWLTLAQPGQRGAGK